jgi:hypothetical protein
MARPAAADIETRASLKPYVWRAILAAKSAIAAKAANAA